MKNSELFRSKKPLIFNKVTKLETLTHNLI